MAAYLAAKLGAFFPIVVVEVLSWSVTLFASALGGNSETFAGLYRIKRAAVFSLIVFEQILPADRRGFKFHCGLRAQRG